MKMVARVEAQVSAGRACHWRAERLSIARYDAAGWLGVAWSRRTAGPGEAVAVVAVAAVVVVLTAVLASQSTCVQHKAPVFQHTVPVLLLTSQASRLYCRLWMVANRTRTLRESPVWRFPVPMIACPARRTAAQNPPPAACTQRLASSVATFLSPPAAGGAPSPTTPVWGCSRHNQLRV